MVEANEPRPTRGDDALNDANDATNRTDAFVRLLPVSLVNPEWGL